MPEFSIQTQDLQDGMVLISVRGFLDAHTFEEMEKTVNELFEASIFKMIVDLSNLDYISSAGAGVFIGAIGTAQENDGKIVLMSPTANVKEVFDLLGLTQIFTFADELNSAIKAFS